jgi:hypothetical protein
MQKIPGSAAVFFFCAPVLHHLLDALCKFGAGSEPFDENRAAFENQVLCGRSKFREVRRHHRVAGKLRSARQLPLDIIEREPHRHNAGLVPGALLTLHYGSSFVQNIAHQKPQFVQQILALRKHASPDVLRMLSQSNSLSPTQTLFMPFYRYYNTLH